MGNQTCKESSDDVDEQATSALSVSNSLKELSAPDETNGDDAKDAGARRARSAKQSGKRMANSARKVSDIAQGG